MHPIAATISCVLAPCGRAIFRHGRACPGHPRLIGIAIRKTWMRGPSPRMTRRGFASFHLRRACPMPLRRLGAIAAIAAAALLWPAQPVLADFVQQGPKLVGTGAVGTDVEQGTSAALSADGNTALVGGPFDSTQAGA